MSNLTEIDVLKESICETLSLISSTCKFKSVYNLTMLLKDDLLKLTEKNLNSNQLLSYKLKVFKKIEQIEKKYKCIFLNHDINEEMIKIVYLLKDKITRYFKLYEIKQKFKINGENYESNIN